MDLDVEELTNLLAAVESISTEDDSFIVGGSNDVITDNDECIASEPDVE